MCGPANPHLKLPPVLAGAPLSDARLACVLVHGRDQDESVMLDVTERLGTGEIAYVLPLAGGRCWYPGRYFEPVAVNEPHLSWALDACDAAIAFATEAGLDAGRIVLGGFSQGACVIAELIARRPRPFAGAAVLTGSLLGPPGERRVRTRVEGLPMFFASSRHDRWIPPGDVAGTARAFEQAGAAVVLEVHDDLEHHINDRAVAGLRSLL